MLASCGSRSAEDIVVTLKASERLEATSLGWWLRELDLPPAGADEYLVKRVRSALPTKAVLRETYHEDGNIVVNAYILRPKKAYLGISELLILEKTAPREGDYHSWIEVSLTPRGADWINLLESFLEERISEYEIKYLMEKTRRKREHVVTIVSPGEQGVRLFLFGWGMYCTHMTLM